MGDKTVSKVRENLNIVVVGHVDHGKSTLIGRLLFDTESLPAGAIEKVQRISAEKGKSFEYAYLLDAFEEEQKQGITIDITMLQFFTKKRDYVIIDAPGHKEFLKNMISGAASAEAAILMVDAKEGIQEQSKRHGYILSLLGIKKVYVAVNKMDLVDYSEERFKEIQVQFNEFLNGLNIYPEKYIPISAFHGENIVSKSDKLPWYEGDSILDTMDNIEKETGIEERSLRFPIQDVYKFDTRRIIAGKIEAGTLKVGDEIVIYPSGKTTKVKTIENWQESDKTDVVSAGMSVGITVEDEFFNKRGEVICHKEDPVIAANVFDANIFWLGKKPLLADKKYKLKLATEEVEFEVLTVNKVIDAATLESKKDLTQINKNDVAEVTIKTKYPICFDEFSKFQATGRFVIIDGYDVSGGGIISSVDEALKAAAKDERALSSVERQRLVTREEREEKLNQKGKVIWLSGLPGSGKNEIAVKLEKKLFDLGKKVYYINAKDLSLKEDDEFEVTRKLAEISNLFVDSGTITIVSESSRLKDAREQARIIVGQIDYEEVFVEASNEICEERDPKAYTTGNIKEYLYEKSDYETIVVNIEKADFDVDKKAQEVLDRIKL